MNAREDIDNRFDYHTPTPERAMEHAGVRRRLREDAHYLLDVLPDSREKSLAITKLEEAMFWANAALARN